MARTASRSPRPSAAASASRPSRNAPKPTIASRAAGSWASTSGHAASSSSTPLDAMSLPTNTTSRSSAPIVASAAAASPWRRAKEWPPASGAVSAAGAESRLRRRGAPEAVAQRRQALERRGAVTRDESADVHAGRAEAGPGGQGGIAHRLPQALPRVPRADEHAARAGEALLRVRLEPRMRLHDVLERAPVDLDRVRDAEAVERPRQDHGPHHQVVRQRHVGRDPLRDLAHGGHVAREIPLHLLVGQVRERPRLHPLVAIRDVQGQQARDVRPVHRGAHGLPPHLHVQAAAIPGAGGVDPRQAPAGRAPAPAGAPRAPSAGTPPPARRCRRSSRCPRGGTRGR